MTTAAVIVGTAKQLSTILPHTKWMPTIWAPLNLTCRRIIEADPRIQIHFGPIRQQPVSAIPFVDRGLVNRRNEPGNFFPNRNHDQEEGSGSSPPSRFGRRKPAKEIKPLKLLCSPTDVHPRCLPLMLVIKPLTLH